MSLLKWPLEGVLYLFMIHITPLLQSPTEKWASRESGTWPGGTVSSLWAWRLQPFEAQNSFSIDFVYKLKSIYSCRAPKLLSFAQYLSVEDLFNQHSSPPSKVLLQCCPNRFCFTRGRIYWFLDQACMDILIRNCQKRVYWFGSYSITYRGLFIGNDGKS